VNTGLLACYCPWGGNKSVDLEALFFFFFWLQMIFVYSHLQVGITLLINILFPLEDIEVIEQCYIKLLNVLFEN
jgi:hypothetical protein